MRLPLRWHIALALAAMLSLVAILGGAGTLMLHQLGGRIDAILRENYRSVLYMQRLNEAVERIDSAFALALAGREGDARSQYEEHWKVLRENLQLEHENITLDGEDELVRELASLAETYRREGDRYFALNNQKDREQEYFKESGGLLSIFRKIKTVSGSVQRLNQGNMEEASGQARRTAKTSLRWFALGVALAAALAGVLAWQMARTIIDPIRGITESARAIAAGNLDQVVPVVARDELGELAQTFNLMAHHLRDYRLSQSAQLLRVQRTTQSTIDSFPDAVLVIDPRGEVELANPAARRLLGVVPKQADQPNAGVWHPPELLREPLADALGGRSDYLPEAFDKALILNSSGLERAVLPRILTMRDQYGDILGAAVLLQDVTRLRLLDQMKGNLVSTASHELKTPLTGIRLAVHLLLEETTGPLTNKQTELLMDARDNCERLLAVVNNLLDLARLEQGSRQLDLRPETVESLVKTVAESTTPRAADKGVEIVLDVPSNLPAVLVDAMKISTALRNLLENAVTYTDPGGRVTMSAAVSSAAGAATEMVTLSVSDTGVGIPPEYLSHVFEKFFRVPGQMRGPGTGLGLAIVQEIAVAHGGTVTCESTPGQGTTFRLTVPVATGSPIPHYVLRHCPPQPES